MWAVFSLHVEAIFSVCCGGIFSLPPPPLNLFAGTPMNMIVITFFLVHRYLYFFQIVEV